MSVTALVVPPPGDRGVGRNYFLMEVWGVVLKVTWFRKNTKKIGLGLRLGLGFLVFSEIRSPSKQHPRVVQGAEQNIMGAPNNILLSPLYNPPSMCNPPCVA